MRALSGYSAAINELPRTRTQNDAADAITKDHRHNLAYARGSWPRWPRERRAARALASDGPRPAATARGRRAGGPPFTVVSGDYGVSTEPLGGSSS